MSYSISACVRGELIVRIDDMVEAKIKQMGGMKISRSAIIKIAIERGLEDMEEEMREYYRACEAIERQ